MDFTNDLTAVGQFSTIFQVRANNPRQLGYYTITGTFTGSVRLESSVDKYNWDPVAVWFGITGGAIQLPTPLYYRFVVLTLDAGTITVAVNVEPFIYFQTLTSLGNVAAQVDDAGLSTSAFYYSNVVTSSSPLINFAVGNKVIYTPTALRTLVFIPPTGPTLLQLVVKQGATPYDIIFPGEVTFPDGADPGFTLSANAIDITTLLFDGTTYYATRLKNFLTP